MLRARLLARDGSHVERGGLLHETALDGFVSDGVLPTVGASQGRSSGRFGCIGSGDRAVVGALVVSSMLRVGGALVAMKWVWFLG